MGNSPTGNSTTDAVVQKLYESIPAYERVKIFVVDRITAISDQLSYIQYIMLIRKTDIISTYRFVSDVIQFYSFLRPKIFRHMANIKMKNTDEYNRYNSLTGTLDYYVLYPRRLGIENAVMLFNVLNQFCEDYNLTNTAMWTGQAAAHGSIYNA